MSDDGQLPTDHPAEDDDRTRIIRRQPQDPVSRPVPVADDPKTSIIRRHPTGAIPTAGSAEPQTSLISGITGSEAQTGLIGHMADDASTSYVPRARPLVIPRSSVSTNPRTSIVAATTAILSGWATGVIATDLIAGWWRTDRLFCVAIGFLAAISAAATIGGLIALLLRRRMGRLLVIVGAVIGLLIFGSLFIAGARLHPVVYAMPVLPLAAILFTALPSTGRWSARR
ncbi:MULTISPECIES: hypothetical protein [unclassified Mycolicibacterium]|uniref:hypothetical protein n=1 Tax=unclassified Mycolicibacterium TaxID=2636767 RepID=UPI00130691E1|nr:MULTISPECIES: hypothetical protein [unclassified Mycolicibacterium]MUL85730.1 hypothetical protein [Mycolicibacterium sp. CBMA 329]MUL91607.1 hypothetical protein [Mycolicibacterium sp. CBMA 331]MUM02154.1 hypothetical protein [Mycolicibacterium sp. CBMA 334]MUM28826.1 hypothetical protein [Mycolicibacterium sp. CBMA 295]MUM41103.1 hypothetical protein [Mycolicibacterium sp. CBMA 247]